MYRRDREHADTETGRVVIDRHRHRDATGDRVAIELTGPRGRLSMGFYEGVGFDVVEVMFEAIDHSGVAGGDRKSVV